MYKSILTAIMMTTLTHSPALADDLALAKAVRGLAKSTDWTLVKEVPINFPTNHPQGMVKIGDVFYVSSVEITQRTTRLNPPKDGYDRDTGAGVGHLYKIDANGNLLGSVTLGEGSIYHPGGIDFDGTHIWVPVAEYRPNSAAIVYKVDPATMKAEEVFRFRDHLGGIVHNTDDGTLHAVTWGARRFYSWAVSDLANVKMTDAVPLEQATMNVGHYIDYQDCHYVGGQEMLCTGVASYDPPGDVPTFRLGGFELVNLTDNRPVHQVPLPLWSPSGLPMTQNPFWMEAIDGGVRGYFMPDDDKSTLFIYEAKSR